MSLEQSIDRLANLVEQLIHQLELARTAVAVAPAEPPKVEAEAPKPEKTPKVEKAPKAEKPAESSGGVTKGSQPSGAGNASGVSAKPTDCYADVAPHFSRLVAKDRDAAVKILKKYQLANGRTGKLCEVLRPEDLEGCLVDVLAALGE